MRDGVACWRDDFVQPTVVPTREPATVTFGNPVEGRSPGAGGREYDSHVENFIPELGVGGDEFIRRETAWSCKDRSAFGDNVMRFKGLLTTRSPPEVDRRARQWVGTLKQN